MGKTGKNNSANKRYNFDQPVKFSQSVKKHSGDFAKVGGVFCAGIDDESPIAQKPKLNSCSVSSQRAAALEQYNGKHGTDLTMREIFAKTPSRRGSDWRTDIASHWFPMSMSDPGHSFGLARDARRAARFSDYLSRRCDIECNAAGAVLRGQVYFPEKPNGKLVLFFSGNGETISGELRYISESFLRQGVTVVAMNYRGLGVEYQDENGHSHNERSETLDADRNVIETRRCEASICKDGEVMLACVLQKLEIDGKPVKPENVILRGFSMGGRVAAHVAENHAKKELQRMLLTGRDPAMLGGLILDSPIDSFSNVAQRCCKKTGIPLSGAAGSIASFFAGDYDTKTSLGNLRRYDPGIPVYYTGGGVKSLKDRITGEDIEGFDFLSPLVTGIDEIAFKNKLVEVHTKNNHQERSFEKLDVFLREGRSMGKRQFVDGDELNAQNWEELKQHALSSITTEIPSYKPEQHLLISSNDSSVESPKPAFRIQGKLDRLCEGTGGGTRPRRLRYPQMSLEQIAVQAVRRDRLYDRVRDQRSQNLR